MKLIINADDFGLSKSVNKGIIEGIKEGFISSTSILMNMEFANDAINLIKINKLKCVGIHLNLTNGKPTLSGLSHIVDSNGNFKDLDKVLKYTRVEEKEIKDEFENQIIKFRKRGLEPSHIDTHKFLHKNPYVFNIVLALCKKYAIPCRSVTKNVRRMCSFKRIPTTDYFYENFYEDGISVDTIKEIIDTHKDKNDIVEIMCHVGYIDANTKRLTSYLHREDELNILKKCMEENVFEGIDFISYRKLKALRR